MAYAALISLRHTIEHLLNSPYVSLAIHSRVIVEIAYKELKPLQGIFERLDWSSSGICSRKRVKCLDGQIREAVCKLEDVIESYVLYEILSQSDRESINGDGNQFSVNKQDLEQHILSITETMKKMGEEYIKESNPLLEEEDDDDDDDNVSSRNDFGRKKSKNIVGLSHQLSKVKAKLKYLDLGLEVVSIVGMPGIGKTTLVNEIFEDLDILEWFDRRVWVTVGRKCQLHEILRVIMAQVNPDCTDEMLTEGDKKIVQYLEESLKDRRFLIVLDDVWDRGLCPRMNLLLPENKNGSRILLTSRLQRVAEYVSNHIVISKMDLMSKEESWDLLREEVFGKELCPPQLEKAGKKIAENCDGLPLTIVTVANLLSEAEKTPEYWNKVAEKQNSVFVDAYEDISKVLYPSYEYLSQDLKLCFLYMGSFPQNFEITKSKLSKIWTAEGYLEPYTWQNSKDNIEQWLCDLISNNVVMLHQESTNSVEKALGIKTCRVHSSMWHLCNREARKNKFLHILNNCSDGLGDGIKSQRRLCIHNNILFGIKNVCKSMEDNCASTARSLLCFGPYHQYPVPICFGLRLVRVFDALTIRFYEFPIHVLKLFQLRYLALTCNGKLPPSISKLWNLQYLIIHRHLSIKSFGPPSYLPMEIWDMKELKHLEIMGWDLPDPCGASLLNLKTLLYVGDHSCTKDIFRAILNLDKLGIQIELLPDAVEPFGCFYNLFHLGFGPRSVKCVIVNPDFGSKFVPPPAPRQWYSSTLRKLHFSGLGYPWKYTSVFAKLESLEVLKLQNYAFRGPTWEVEERTFRKLRFLLIEDTDLVHLKVGVESFQSLFHVSIKHCYKLKELHFDTIPSKIEVVDCHSLKHSRVHDVYVRSSDDENLNKLFHSKDLGAHGSST